eukprot:TRINITY_DN45455_c0_g1_i1.p1 TRINITY_DN45455_c0_g1~~TRINITY_DN45455_c0_g1_i1.p1  ORF type:complete len:457 (-),score=63.17 TRINITY_DN45455_c0_g1_i1:281-1588(-)
MATAVWASAFALSFGSAEALEPFVPIPEPLIAWDSTSLASSLVGATGGPTLAKSWTADFVQISAGGKCTGRMFYDMARLRWRNSYCCEAGSIFHPDDQMCFDQLAKHDVPGNQVNVTVGKGDDKICKVFPTPFYDILQSQILANATRTGETKMIDGVSCSVWAASMSILGQAVNISTCVGLDGVPREQNMTSSTRSIAARTQSQHLYNVTLGKPDEAALAPFEVCTERYPQPPCANSTIEKFDVYRTRTLKEPNDLDNRNTGNALGDMAFFCATSAAAGATQVVTRWEVQAITSWGQYAYCLYNAATHNNTCLGNTGKQVGRESAMGLGVGRLQGQCSPNEDVGSWYSFPAEGRCPQGAKIGTDGCTWAAAPVRTVNASCILSDRGLKQMCAQERGHAPLSRSAAIFEAALASADPAKGGCPDVENEAAAAILVV